MSLLAVMLLALCSAGRAAEDIEREPGDADRVWAHECFGPIVYLELTKGSFLNMVCRDKKDKKKLKRFLLDADGAVLREMDANMSHLLAAKPSPLFLEADEGGFHLHALSPSGRSLWRAPLNGLPGGVVVDEKAARAAVLTILGGRLGVEDEERHTQVALFDLTGGRALWETPLGRMRASMESLGGQLQTEAGALWVAGDGVTALLDEGSGRLLWKAEGPERGKGDGLLWPVEGGALLLKHGEAFAYSAEAGLRWRTRVVPAEEGASAAASETPQGIVVGFWGKNKATIARLDAETGAPAWTVRKKQKKSWGTPPKGVATTRDKVVFAIARRLAGLDLSTGEELYAVKIDKKLYPYLRELASREGRVVLTGSHGAQTFDLEDGGPLWTRGGFQTPVEFRRRQDARTAALTAQAVQMTVGGGSAAGSYYRDKAKSASSYFSYNMWMSQAYAADSKASREATERREKALGNLFSRFRISQLVAFSQPETRHIRLSRIINTNWVLPKAGSKANAVLLDLDTGDIKERRVREARLGCVSNILIDLERDRVVQTYKQAAPICKDEHRLEVFPWSK